MHAQMAAQNSAPDEAAAVRQSQPARRQAEQEMPATEFVRRGRERMDEIGRMLTATAARVERSEALIDSAAAHNRRAQQAVERAAVRLTVHYPFRLTPVVSTKRTIDFPSKA